MNTRNFRIKMIKYFVIMKVVPTYQKFWPE